jgi:hypothetical protein
MLARKIGEGAMQTEIDSELLKGVVQVGLLATWHRMLAQADDILAGVKAFNKDWPPLNHAYGLLYYSRGDSAAALEVLRAHPQDAMAKSLTAFLLQQTGQQGWRELCREVCEQEDSGAAKDLAVQLLRGDLPYPSGISPHETALSTVRG